MAEDAASIAIQFFVVVAFILCCCCPWFCIDTKKKREGVVLVQHPVQQQRQNDQQVLIVHADQQTMNDPNSQFIVMESSSGYRHIFPVVHGSSIASPAVHAAPDGWSPRTDGAAVNFQTYAVNTAPDGWSPRTDGAAGNNVSVPIAEEDEPPSYSELMALKTTRK